MTDEINPDAPSPWVMCPNCAGTWHRILCVLEKGEWGDDGVYRTSSSPNPNAFVLADHGAAIECDNCGHRFDAITPNKEGQP